MALARILVNEPDILLLDEPFSALDAGLKEQVMAELTDVLRQFDKDVVVVTHSYEEAYRLCRTIAVLHDGSIDVIGERDAVFSQPQSKTAASLMGCRNIVPAWKTGRRTVFVPSWNCEFAAACDVKDELCAVGIRERSFSGCARQFAGRFDCRRDEAALWNVGRLPLRRAEARRAAPRLAG